MLSMLSEFQPIPSMLSEFQSTLNMLSEFQPMLSDYILGKMLPLRHITSK